MFKNIALTTSIVAGTTTTAIAGGLSEPVMTPVAPAPIVAPAMASNDWTGFYVGGSVGTGNVAFNGGDESDLNNYGLHAGYQADMGSYVLGGEVEYSMIDIDGVGDDDDGSVLRLKGRVGYDAGSFLPYFTAGAANLTIDDLDADDFGYFYGVGVDFAATDSLTIGGEVLQHEFEDFDGSGDDVSAMTMGLRVSYTF